MRLARVAALLLALLIPITASTTAEYPQLLTPEQTAKQLCPADVVAWVNTYSGIYYFKGRQLYYAKTKRGAFVCKKEADKGRVSATRDGQEALKGVSP